MQTRQNIEQAQAARATIEALPRTERWKRNLEAQGPRVLMPGHVVWPDRRTEQTGEIFWILALTEDGVQQIGRIYRIKPGVLESLPDGGWGAEFLPSFPTPERVRAEIVPPVAEYDDVWIECCERLLNAGAVTLCRVSEVMAVEPEPVF